MNEKFKWVVEFEVDRAWVAQKFNLTQAQAQRMIEEEIPGCRPNEVKATIVDAPSQADIMRARGHKVD